MARKKTGPKPKLTADVKAEFLLLLQVGLSQADTLLALDVTYEMVRHARRKDSKFHRGIKGAAAKGKGYHLKRVNAGVPNWQSSAWFLERKYGAEYGQKVKLDVNAQVSTRIVEQVIDGPAEDPRRNGAAARGAASLPPG